jgi:hypothetical protein
MSGIGTRLLTMTIDSVDVTAEVSKGVITSNDAGSDFTTFADAAAGGAREYRLEFTAVQDAATGSLWDTVWTAAGTSVPFILKPYGNAVATPAQPHFEGTATVTEPDGDLLGGAADSSTSARFTIDCAWVCDAKPTRVTA